MEITEEQIKEAHNAACSQWKQKIEQWFPECFNKKLEAGKWYKSEYYEYIIFNLKEINNNICFGYGVNGSKWYDDISFMPVKSAIPATTEEVESMLIKEAEKKGFIDGVEYDNTNLGFGSKGKISSKCWIFKDGTLRQEGNNSSINCHFIMQDGKWATIVETSKEMTLEEIEKQLGHKVKIVS